MKTIANPKPTARSKSRKKSVHIRLDPAIHQKADQLARADKRSFSQFVEVALERYLSATQHEADTFAMKAFTATEHGFGVKLMRMRRQPTYKRCYRSVNYDRSAFSIYAARRFSGDANRASDM